MNDPVVFLTAADELVELTCWSCAELLDAAVSGVAGLLLAETLAFEEFEVLLEFDELSEAVEELAIVDSDPNAPGRETCGKLDEAMAAAAEKLWAICRCCMLQS